MFRESIRDLYGDEGQFFLCWMTGTYEGENCGRNGNECHGAE